MRPEVICFLYVGSGVHFFERKKVVLADSDWLGLWPVVPADDVKSLNTDGVAAFIQLKGVVDKFEVLPLDHPLTFPGQRLLLHS